MPGNLCRFNSPQPTSFECKFNLRGDGPESPATYIDSKSAAPERDDAGSVTSDHSPVCVARSVKFSCRHEEAMIKTCGHETHKGLEDNTQQTPGNVVDIGSRPFNRESTARKNIHAIAEQTRNNVVEIRKRSSTGVS